MEPKLARIWRASNSARVSLPARRAAQLRFQLSGGEVACRTVSVRPKAVRPIGDFAAAQQTFKLAN
jgi:hypothetical protein